MTCSLLRMVGPITPHFFVVMPDVLMLNASGRFLLAIALLIGGCLLGVEAQAQSARTVTRTVHLNADGEVAVNVVAGHVRVRTWDSTAVDVRARIEGSGDSQGNARVRVEGGPREVKIKTEGADAGDGGLLALLGFGEAEGPETHYTLRVPATASLSVTTDRAPVEIHGLKGGVSIEGSSSPIQLRDVGGDVKVATFSGSLDADGLQSDLMFATFSGNATVRREAVGGMQLATFSGDAEITLPADAAFDLRTDVSWGGSVTSDFAVPDSSEEGEGPLPIGGGGPTVAFESFSGSLTLRAE